MQLKGYVFASTLAGLAAIGAAAWIGESAGGGVRTSGALSGAFLGSLIGSLGFGSQLRQKNGASLQSLGIFFFVKLLFLFGVATLFWLQPQLGDHVYYLGSFLGGALLSTSLGILFFLNRPQGEPRVSRPA